MRSLVIVAALLAGCTTQEWYERKPPPPERCVIVSDGMNTVCVPESKVREWAQRNGI